MSAFRQAVEHMLGKHAKWCTDPDECYCTDVRGLIDEPDEAERYRAEVVDLYEEWMANASGGIISGSAADQLSDVYAMLGRLGHVVP